MCHDCKIMMSTVSYNYFLIKINFLLAVFYWPKCEVIDISLMVYGRFGG